MFKIGEFSRLGLVTVETLRHYDAVGILKPEKVDPFTGYRYYSAKQLRALNRILALKELGFSLEEIARILQNDLSDDELRGMLKLQLIAAEREMEAVQSRLNLVTTRLQYLKLEDDMTAYEVTLKSVNTHTVAAIREVVRDVEQVPERCNTLFSTIAQWMAANKVPFGTPVTTYYNESYTHQNIDLECAFILPDPAAAAKAAPPPAPIELRQIEAVPNMAVTIVTDDFHNKVEGLTPAYNALGKWIEANNYKIAGPPRELFHGSPQNGDLTAEIQFPVEKV
ncbi:MAG: MerR family transcriptional regulator [Anaerolineaceae bacterium]|nr:MerR family transcriptional regulator [Anaerolineaceae bacterium]